MSRRYFGTDGIRGKYGSDPMTPEFLYRVGCAAASHFEPHAGHPLVVARDTRASGAVLESAFCQGVADAGGAVFRAGVIPTAAVAAVLLRRTGAGGAMISASHNPASDNGIKFFTSSGGKLDDAAEEKLEAAIHSAPTRSGFAEPSLNFSADLGAVEDYYSTLRNSLPEGFHLKGWKIVVDASNGAAYQTTPDFLRLLGAEVHAVAAEPDGRNINDQCGSQHPEAAREAVMALAQDMQGKQARILGLCHDGDADRLVLIDEKGGILDGDELLAILGCGLLREGSLPGCTLAATVMSNLGLDACLAKHGGSVLRTAVGDRYVLEAMRDRNLVLGGEQSGHMLFLDHLPTGDGLLTALQVLRFLVASGRPLSEERQIMEKFPQHLTNLKVVRKVPFDELPEVAAAVRAAEACLGSSGRVLLRYSGTEHLARLMIESQDASLIEPLVESIMKPLSHSLGVSS